MYGEKKLTQAYNLALYDANRLSLSLQALGKIASDIYGEELVADLCGGEEIEFRHILGDDVPDSYDIIRIEDLYNKLRNNK